MDTGADSPARSMEKLQSGGAWRHIQQEFFATGLAAPVQAGLTLAVDAMAVQAYQSTIGLVPKGSSMFAIGGFGRRELFPYSDVDILILHEAQPTSQLKQAIAEFIRLLWDAGLRLNHSAGTIAEIMDVREHNLELSINLLDWRFLAGDKTHQLDLEAKLPALVSRHGQKLGQHLCQWTRARHAKYQDTPNHCEPDVKEAPG